MYNIRCARPDESGALSALAEMAKSYWGYSREQLALWADELRLTPESIASEPTFVVEHDGELAGVVQLCTMRPSWSLECLWVHPTAIRQGVGSLLIEHAVAHARAHGRAELEIDADPNAEGFYLRLGARRVGQVRAPIDGQPGRVRPQLVLAIDDAGASGSHHDPRTVQDEGIAEFPTDADLERVQQAYFAAFPDGTARLAWPDITYVRVNPTWIRCSDYRSEPPRVVEREFWGGADGARNHNSP